MTWTLVFTRRAQKDGEKLASSGLKQAEELLQLLSEDPFRKAPPFESWSAIWQGRTRVG